MGIKKYFSAGKRFAAVGGLALILISCESIYEIPKRAAEEVITATYRIAELPLVIMPWLKSEPPVNGCIETSSEKVCRSYLETSTPELGREECFAVLKETYGFFGLDSKKLIFGYWNEDKVNVRIRDFDEEDGKEDIITDAEKYLVVVMYEGIDSEKYIDPAFGHPEYPYVKFKRFFAKPRENTLDTSDNPLGHLTRESLIGAVQLNILRERLRERFGDCLKLADEQLPKYNK